MGTHEKVGLGVGNVVTSGVLVSGTASIALRFLDLAVAILLIHWLSIFEFGLYRLSLAAYDFATSFFLSGIENVVVSDTSGILTVDPKQARARFSAYIYFLFFIGTILWGVFFFGANILGSWVLIDGGYLRIISFLFLLAPFETAMKLKFQIFLNFGWANVFRILRDVFRLGAILAAFYFTSFGVREALGSLVIAVLLPMISIATFYRKPLLVYTGFKEILISLKGIFFYHGKWAVFDDFLYNTGKNIRPFIIRYFVGTEAVAIFAVAQNLYTYTTSVFPIREVLTPILPRITTDLKRLVSQATRAAKYSAYAYFLVAIAGAISAPVFIYLIFPKYAPSLPIYYILLIGLPSLGYRSVIIPVFYALRQQKTLFVLTTLRLMTVAILGVVLVYTFGVYGAALEIVFINIILTPTFSHALSRVLPSWRPSFSSIFTIDDADRVAYAQVKLHIKAQITKLWLITTRWRF